MEQRARQYGTAWGDPYVDLVIWIDLRIAPCLVQHSAGRQLLPEAAAQVG